MKAENVRRIAQALRAIGEGHIELADALAAEAGEEQAARAKPKAPVIIREPSELDKARARNELKKAGFV
ncbi:MAG TPA: hypothetical protein VM580_21640, partial [Labilithrix sp.]|nr:hypothetical protein [Labilithrix sp.]